MCIRDRHSSSPDITPSSRIPRISSRISTSHAPVTRTVLAKFRPFRIQSLASAFSSSVSRSKKTGVFSNLNILNSGSRPVSYTHLDVYKRQEPICFFSNGSSTSFRCWRRRMSLENLCALWAMPASTLMTLSLIHI